MDRIEKPRKEEGNEESTQGNDGSKGMRHNNPPLLRWLGTSEGLQQLAVVGKVDAAMAV
jgi:hypothetical protein